MSKKELEILLNEGEDVIKTIEQPKPVAKPQPPPVVVPESLYNDEDYPPSDDDVEVKIKKFKEIHVVYAVIVITVFLAMYFISPRCVTTTHANGETTLNLRRYIGISGLTSLLICGGVYAWQRFKMSRMSRK